MSVEIETGLENEVELETVQRQPDDGVCRQFQSAQSRIFCRDSDSGMMKNRACRPAECRCTKRGNKRVFGNVQRDSSQMGA